MLPCAGLMASNTCSETVWINFSEFLCDDGNLNADRCDMVKLLHGEGTIGHDGEPIQVDGRFVHTDLLELNPS